MARQAADSPEPPWQAAEPCGEDAQAWGCLGAYLLLPAWRDLHIEAISLGPQQCTTWVQAANTSACLVKSAHVTAASASAA